MRDRGYDPKTTTREVAKKLMALQAEYQNRLADVTRSGRPYDPVVHQFDDGWHVVELSDEGQAADERIVGEHLSGGGNVRFSIRDPNGVPFALIEADTFANDPSDFGVYEVKLPYWGDAGQVNDGEKYIKGWFDHLRMTGRKPKWVNDDFSNGEKDIAKHLPDAFDLSYGAAPLLRGIGGDEEGYLKAIEDAYSESFGGSYYYSNAAAKHIDNLVEYAYQRGEEKLLEQAEDSFFEKASGWFEDHMMESKMEHPYPDEDDFRTMVKPDAIPGQKEFKGKAFKGKPVEKFDQEGYDKAMKAHDEERGQMEEYFEPYQFLKYLRQEIQRLEGRRAKDEAELQNRRQEYESKMSEQRMQQAIERAVSRGEEPDIESLIGEERGVSFASTASWYRNADAHRS
jgi:hypothetical protein